jgi:hypothetical protein
LESDDEIKILYENWLYHKAKIIFKEKVKIKAFQKIAIVVCLENIDSIIEDENSIRLGVMLQISSKSRMSTTKTITNG